MSKHHFSRLTNGLLAAAAMTAVLSLAQASTPSVGPASMEAFAKADGTIYFALTVPPVAASAADAAGQNIVALFDTSASQAGTYREDAMAALRSMLAGLGASDRVRLIAVDIDATPLTASFVAPNSAEMTAALDKLDRRVPLGATDLEKGLATAVTSLAGQPEEHRTLVYFGQGRSPANFFTAETLGQTIKALREARVSIDICAVGPRIDPQLVGILAYQTGGQVVTPGRNFDGRAAGQALAATVHATVLWPTATAWPSGISEVLPKTAPPLRSDRDTVFLGSYKGAAKGELKIDVKSAGGAQSLAWAINAPAPSDDNNYLVALVDAARTDGGATLPLVDSGALKLVKHDAGLDAKRLIETAKQALSMGNTLNAARIAEEVLRRDPNNPEALTIKRSAEKSKVTIRPTAFRMAAPAEAVPATPGPAAAAPAAGNPQADLTLVNPQPAAAPVNVEGGLAQSVDRDRRMLAQVVQAEVQTTINQARSQMATDPATALQTLRLKREELRQVHDLPADVRDQLVAMLETALRDATRRQVELEQIRLQQQERATAAKERQLLNENLMRNQEKLKQLMARFDALVTEGDRKSVV